MSQSAFAYRDLRFTFALLDGRTFRAGSKDNALQVNGLMAEVVVTNIVSSGIMPYQASAIIYGLTPDQINSLTTVGKEYGFMAPTRAPYMTIEAGSLGGPYATVFSGPVFRSMFRGDQPNTCLIMLARWSSLLQMTSITPTSFNGSVPVETIASAIANKVQPPLGPLKIENNGVNTVLAYPYFAGSVRDQIQGIASAAHCYVAADVPNTIALYPQPDGARQANKAIPVISAANGMIGYPDFDGLNINVRTIYSPSLTLGPGRLFEVQSFLSGSMPLQAANGKWAARSVTYHLSSQMPKGPWEMELSGYPPNGIKGQPPQVGMLDWSALN